MNASNPMAAEILESSAAGFAAAANARMQSKRTDRAVQDSSVWQAHLLQRVLELAAAVRIGEPALFTRRITWLRRAVQGRGADEGDVALALASLRDALRDELPAALRGSVLPTLERALGELDQSVASEPEALQPTEPAGRLGLEYVSACVEGDTDRGRELVLTALENGMPAEDLYCKVLIPAQKEVGQLWHAGDINVAEEHLVTETTRALMTLIAARCRVKKKHDKKLLAASVAGNAHDMGLRAVADLFELAGWTCLYLGANVPTPDLVRAVESFRVDLVVLTASLSTQLGSLGSTIAEIKRLAPESKILVGGIAFEDSPDSWQLLGADGFASRIDEAVARGNELVAAR